MQYNIGIKKKDDMNYIIYDEIDLEVELDFRIQNEAVVGFVKSFTQSKGGKNRERDLPVYSSIKITP